ncbi:pimeloyl-ACP methyl ester carboxylesterase [Allocatelliglobosispora scoriae]|uniref:Pimeloyl-ACP methyl ester carboxylesterase n=1 Tax=Allocatelliglobosispora scoriae TaxID=643052 RepID=A0A841BP47_9ACTN|nr:alpha/beta hydrolase [Allocatelliglobosispora scoriae]MBB5870044.1 pimeloyl-ACP methyl ester carboxylesterase [Allocatelliglobosispora scoriae]
MHRINTDMLDVPGASLYFEVRGSGPTFLIIPTGNGDAAPFGPVANALADSYTVVTYDRRGFSRSPQHEPFVDADRVAMDADDAVRLLDHVGAATAHAFGSSSGAIVALAMLERAPQRLRTLIAHEPPLASILPDAQEWLRFYEDLYIVYRAAGIEAGRQMFRNKMGMGTPTKAPENTAQSPHQLAEMLERIRGNQPFWFEHEIRTYPAYLPDRERLCAAAEKLVLAGGTTSRGDFPYWPNQVLAEWVGTEILDFPGGHVGYVTHPEEFISLLTKVLTARG